MKLLVTGGAGMLAHDVLRVAAQAGHELLAIDLPELDITDPSAVGAYFERHRPDAVINCAAWTDVDGAESHPLQAHAVNATGAGNLARAAASSDAALLHLSTDYVFDGHAPLDAEGRARPYLESDPTGPASVYGQSKLAGELEVLAASPRHTIVRSAWLFGVNGRNFVDTMLRLAAEREAVQVVEDQVGCPTWTGHLAPALLGLLEREVRGLVHLAGSGASLLERLRARDLPPGRGPLPRRARHHRADGAPRSASGLFGARLRAPRGAADARLARRARRVPRRARGLRAHVSLLGPARIGREPAPPGMMRA